jgi:hypothetical protein
LGQERERMVNDRSETYEAGCILHCLKSRDRGIEEQRIVEDGDREHSITECRADLC